MAKRAARPGRVAEAITGDGDLVGDVASGRQSLSALPESQLPDDLRRMSPSERQAHVDRQMSERRTLNEQLSALVQQRDRHIADTREQGAAARRPIPSTARSSGRCARRSHGNEPGRGRRAMRRPLSRVCHAICEF